MSDKVIGTLYSIEYRGYCPEGWPQRLCEMFVPGHSIRTPPEIANFPISLGGGYTVTISHLSQPTKPLNQQALASVRRKRAERRIRAKAPMFADQFLAQEFARNPDYYNGITDAHIQEQYDQARAADERLYAERMSRPNVLVVFASEPEGAKIRAAENYAAMARAREIAVQRRAEQQVR